MTEVSALRARFAAVDKNGSGSIDKSELGRLLLDATGEEATPNELDDMFAHIDKDHDGTLSFDEFAYVVRATHDGTLPFRKLRDALAQFDRLMQLPDDTDDEDGPLHADGKTAHSVAHGEMMRPEVSAGPAPSKKASLGGSQNPKVDAADDADAWADTNALAGDAPGTCGAALSRVFNCCCGSYKLYSKDALAGKIQKVCCCAPRVVVYALTCALLPPLWVWMSLKLLVWPCLVFYVNKILGWPLRLCCGAMVKCVGMLGCVCDLRYCDPMFECVDGPMTGFNDSEGGGVNVDVEWRRPADIFGDGGVDTKLFREGVSPDDVDQGSLGDCWLLAAFASAAEFPHMIRRAFNSTESNWRGRYELTLYDGAKKKWCTVVIDDRIPCRKGTKEPVFCKPAGRELWVLLLEKAFAKFVGGYHNLSGGHAIWALQALTGDNAYTLRRENKAAVRWTRDDMLFRPTPQNRRAVKWTHHLGEDGDVEVFDDSTVFDMLCKYDKLGFVMTAASHTKGRQSGIVGGHAYSLIQVRKVKGLQLMQLRNPWGHFEWDGDWSDKSPLWDENPKVKAKLGHTDGDDGVFWMAFSDYLRFFDAIDVLQRSVDLHDVFLDTHDEYGIAGPAIGCCAGLCRYYFCCRGAASPPTRR